jgi:hypothetical protein
MIGILFSVLVVVSILSIFGEFFMRVRLTKNATHDKIAWWRRGGDEVAASYSELFPDSRLLFFRQLVFWLLVTSAAIFALSILLRKSH